MGLPDTGFNWKMMREIAIKIKVERAIAMVQGDNPNSDMAIKHPEWVRAAQQKNYTELTKKITEQTKRAQDEALRRRNKVARKD